MLADHFTSQLVGFARRRAVADGDQLHAMLHAQLVQGVYGLVPLLAWFVRIDGVGGYHLAGGIHYRDLAAGADARVQAQYRTRTGRCGEQQVFQVVAEHGDGFCFRLLARLAEQVQQQMQVQLGAPGHARAVQQPAIGRAALVTDAGVQRDATIGVEVAAVGVLSWIKLQVQEFFLACAEQGQQAMRRNLRQHFAVLEVVAIFRAGFFLAFSHARTDHAHFVQPAT